MSKKKRECGREYNEKKREREYYDKYKTMMGKRESMNTMASIGLQRVGHYAYYLATSQCIKITFMMLSWNMSY